MAAISRKKRKLLEPYLIGESADENGEHGMFCPLHEDSKRSASINLEKGVWYCHAGCGGGLVSDLFAQSDDWVEPSTNGASYHGTSRKRKDVDPESLEAAVAGWRSSLLSSPKELRALKKRRRLDDDTIVRFELGWDKDQQAYTIPVRDRLGAIVNVRRYQLDPPDDRRKIWSIAGMGSPVLYPISVLDDDPHEIVVCEGEMDALLTNQMGFPAITKTGGATTWNKGWNNFFQGKVVYLVHDRDEAGIEANRKVYGQLKRVAAEVHIVTLPYKRTKKHGKDLTDFWTDYSVEDFKEIISDDKTEGGVEEIESISVLESFDAKRVGDPVKLEVTIKGKREQGYPIPLKVELDCDMSAGDKCAHCPLQANGGHDTYKIEANDPVVLDLIESSKLQVEDKLRQGYGAEKCSRLSVDVQEHQMVEVLLARPSLDSSEDNADAGAYKGIKITTVGYHDTLPNNTVEVIGALHPDPRNQSSEFLAWQVDSVETSVDKFDLTPEVKQRLKKFRARKGQRPLSKVMSIADSMAEEVTRIYHRPELHAVLDLVYHSALSFDFCGDRVRKGWMDALIMGDTRTGKSKAAKALINHYRLGEIVSCEAVSFAGIVGGLVQHGNAKDWMVQWGVIPLNDRRIVVLDEVSGLSQEQIAQMSNVRSEGIVKIQKVHSEAAHARTRLVWLGNPRNHRMSDYTYGAQAIKPLIGNSEDIARFDVAMSLKAEEVQSTDVNRASVSTEPYYTSDDCRNLVLWVWSRKHEQVRWTKRAENKALKLATEFAKRYVEEPPLVQASDIRVKIARVATAMAARLFSTDETCENIIVKPEHVEDAVKFLDQLYGMRGFGYREMSQEAIQDRREAIEQWDDVKQWLISQPGLIKFLRNVSPGGTFRRADLEETLNLDRAGANGIINKLWEAHMVRREKGDVRIAQTLHNLLRETK